MANDHRIARPDGEKIDYTCENRRYKTNVEKGYPHGREGRARGSVTPEPLHDGGSYSLWLEHVIEKNTGKKVFWLMWYRQGKPTIPASGILDADDLGEMIQNLVGVRREVLEDTA